MTYCHRCGHHLTLGYEIYCPKCGTLLQSSTVSDIDKEIDNSNSGSISKRDETRIGNVGGNVSGVGVSGTGNMFGGKVEYSVHGNIINLHVESVSAETLQQLENIMSIPIQLETKSFHDKQTYEINTELTDAKVDETKATKEETNQVLRDIDQIGRDKGVHIEQVRVGAVQISRTELTLRDAILEGNEHYYKGEYSKAIEYYDKALAIDSKNVDAWINKGSAFDGLGKYDEAIRCVDKALEIDEKYVNAWRVKGVVLYSLGKYDEAIKCYDKALEIDEKYVDAWNNKGIALYSLGKYDEAIKCYDKALEIDGKYVHAWNNKGNALYGLGRHDEAIE